MPRRTATTVAPVFWPAACLGLVLALVTDCAGGAVGGGPGTVPPPGGMARLEAPAYRPGAVEVQALARPHQVWVHGSYVVCLDQPGRVQVTDVAFAHGSLEVVRWALRPPLALEDRVVLCVRPEMPPCA